MAFFEVGTEEVAIMAVTTSKTWADLNVTLQPSVIDALKANNFTHTTPVQASCVPLLCQNKDVAAEAVTGRLIASWHCG